MHAETLHNPFHLNKMAVGDVMVLDAGVETPNRIASDITRTIPVGGKFSGRQRGIYQAVLNAQLADSASRTTCW